ncbi:hypothetical protein VUR80DRAFT_8908 [Thermomyces stellatus]
MVARGLPRTWHTHYASHGGWLCLQAYLCNIAPRIALLVDPCLHIRSSPALFTAIPNPHQPLRRQSPSDSGLVSRQPARRVRVLHQLRQVVPVYP